MLGNGYRVRGSPLSFRTFATTCDNTSFLPNQKTISNVEMTLHDLQLVIGWFRDGAGSAGVSYSSRNQMPGSIVQRYPAINVR
jgi:hypothetical protein